MQKKAAFFYGNRNRKPWVVYLYKEGAYAFSELKGQVMFYSKNL